MKKSHAARVLSVAFLAACLVGAPLLSACSDESAAPEEKAPTEPTYAVQIFIDCEQNLIFSKYDVDVMVDGVEVGNIEHGGEATFEVELTRGQHELGFEEEGRTDPDGKTSFVVEGEGDAFAYRIRCTSDQIEIESIEDEPEEQETAAEQPEPSAEEGPVPDPQEEATPEAEAAPESSKYEYACVKRGPSYDLYYLIDLDEMTATYFGTNESGSMVMPCTGDLEGGLTIDYGDEGFVERLQYKQPGDDSVVILTDGSGFDWEFEKADVAEAEAVLESVG